MRNILLISNTFCFGKGFLEHAKEEIYDLLGSKKSVLFVPYALHDRDWYAGIAKEGFEKLGLSCTSIHTAANPQKALEEAESVFIGGGNTFRLLSELYQQNIIQTVRKRIEEGMPYFGASAGANVACLSIKTTNDMPIVYPPSFDGLQLVPFQINPHYLDPDPNSKHMGETREKRIQEFHEENDTPVIGIREGAWLRVKDNSMTLGGETGAKLFLKGKVSQELATRADLSYLL